MARSRSSGTERTGPGGGKPSVPSSARSVDVERLLHDLRVHQIELEAQNEELKSARIDLETALAGYTELFDFAPIGYVAVGHDGNVLEVNHVAARLLGRLRAPLVGTRFSDLLVIPDRAVYGSLVGRAMDSNEREDAEVEIWRATDRRVFVKLSAMVLGRSERSKILLGVEDITERRERDEKLRLTERALREADRRKDDFLAVLSHELRNPLAPIRNALYIMARAEPGSNQATRAREIVERQTAHLTRLVDDLLDVTRIARGKIDLQKKQVEIGELVRRTVDDHRAGAEAAGIALKLSLAPGAVWIAADPARIVQAVSNILGNALKFTPTGGTIAVETKRREAFVELTVTDSGSGIAREVLPFLFEPFAQGPQTMERARGGLGLGLAMVRGLVELHGGTVDIWSEGANRGTVLTMRLPVLEEAARATQRAPQEEQVEPRRVLVIEDNVDAADTLRDALGVHGHQVEVAYDGPRALALARSFRPDVVICDIGLPGMDGYTVARAFRAMSGDGPYLVALTGYAQREDIDRALTAGFDCHIAKPPSLEALDRMIGGAPRRHRDEPGVFLH